MMRDLSLAMPLNSALARDVSAILHGDETAVQLALNGAKRAALPLGIIAVIVIAFFALGEYAKIWRGSVSPTNRHSTLPVQQNFPDRDIVIGRPPDLARTLDARPAPTAHEKVAIVPEPVKRSNDPVLKRGMRRSPKRIVARSTAQGAAPNRRAAPATADAVRVSPTQDRRQDAALATPIASAIPVASQKTEQSAGYTDNVAAVIDETAAAAVVATRLERRRQAAIDAIRNLRRQ